MLNSISPTHNIMASLEAHESMYASNTAQNKKKKKKKKPNESSIQMHLMCTCVNQLTLVVCMTGLVSQQQYFFDVDKHFVDKHWLN